MSGPAEPGEEKARWHEIFAGRLGLYTLVLNLGTLLFAISTFVVVAIMPTVAGDIGGLRFYAWTFALFSVGSVIGSAGSGPMQEAYGQRAAYVGAGVLFVAGLVGAATAPDMLTLVFWRLVQGVGGGAIASQGYILIARNFPDRLRGKALAVVSTAWGVATFLGPTFGGAFAQFGMWRSAFWSLAGLGLLFSVMAWRVVPPSDRTGRLRNFPVNRLLLLGAAVLGVSATSQIEANSVRAVLVILSVVVAGIAFRRDSRAEFNLFPRQAMAIRSDMGSAFWMMMLITMSMIFLNMFVTFYLQRLFGVEPIVAAYLYVLTSLAWSGTAFLISSWQGARETAAIIVGFIFIFAGLAGTGLAVAGTSVVVIGILLALTGAGLGLINNPVIQRAIAAAPPEEKARTGSSIQALRTLGHSFGAAVAGLVAAAAGFSENVTRDAIVTAMQWVYATGAVLPVLGLILVLIWIAGRNNRRGAEAAAK